MRHFLLLISLIFSLLACKNETPQPSIKSIAEPISVAESVKDTVSEIPSTTPSEEKTPFAAIISKAKEHSKTYDAIPYFQMLDSISFSGFWAVNGKWEMPDEEDWATARGNYKMGIIDFDGEVLIPLVYNFIYPPNAQGWMEVERAGKRGFINEKNEIIIPIEYDNFYPIDPTIGVAQVEKNGQFGWLDKEGIVHFDENSAADKRLFQSPFKTQLADTWTWKLSAKTNAHHFPRLHYTPNYNGEEDNSPLTIFFAPSWMKKMNLLPVFIKNLHTNEAFSEVIDHSQLSINKIHDAESGWKAFVSSYTKKGVQTRTYDYTQEYISIYNKNTWSKVPIEIRLKRRTDYICSTNQIPYFVSDNLLEVQSIAEFEYPAYYFMTRYRYFEIDAQKNVKPLKINRIYPFTSLRKISKNDFRGCFMSEKVVNSEAVTNGDERALRLKTNHLNADDLDVMVNEIYADYGYKFKSEKWQQYFKHYDWYAPKYDNVDDKLSELEKENIEFIRAFQKELEANEASYITKETVAWVAAG